MTSRGRAAGGPAASVGTSGGTSAPAAINVVEFAEARATDLHSLSDQLKQAGGAGLVKNLPRHLRRRAMSHNPRPHHAPINRGAQDKEVSRPGRRRAGVLLAPATRSKRPVQWLETHIWHAKRMHMTELWGYRLAERAHAHGPRANHTFNGHHAVVHDASYIQLLEITASTHHDILQALATVMDPRAVDLFANERYRSGTYACDSVLHERNSFPLGAIGPASLWWRPCAVGDIGCTVRISTHPACTALAVAALSTGVQVRNVTSRVARIRLWGAHVHEVMRKVLQPVGPPSDAAKAWEAVTANAGSSEGYARRCILSLIVRDPRLRVAAEESRALGVPNTWPEVSVKSVLWMDGTYATCPPDHVLNARRAELAVSCAGSHSAASAPVPVFLEQLNGGWEMLMPASYAMAFWVALVHAGARVAALSDVAQTTTDMGMAVFPRDYADTPAGRSHAMAEFEKEAAIQQRRPPSQRISLLEPHILPAGNYIIRSTPTLACLAAAMRDGTSVKAALKGRPNDTGDAVVLVRVEMKLKGVPVQNGKIAVERDGKYETIGHMTCGAFSLAKGCGAGLGLVRAHELARRVHVQCSADDEHYRLAMLGVVMPR